MRMTNHVGLRWRAFGAAAWAGAVFVACTGSDGAAPAVGGMAGRDTGGVGGGDTGGDAGSAGRSGGRTGGTGGNAGRGTAATGGASGRPSGGQGGRAGVAGGGRGGRSVTGDAGSPDQGGEAGNGIPDDDGGEGGDAGEATSSGGAGGTLSSGGFGGMGGTAGVSGTLGSGGFGGTGGTAGVSGTAGTGGDSGGTATGGGGGTPPDPCAPVGCTDQIQRFSGDRTNSVSIVGGVGVRNWYWIDVLEREDDSSGERTNLGVRITLTSPPGVDYDLVWTCDSSCSGFVGEGMARGLDGHNESLIALEGDRWGDQSFTFHVGIITYQAAQDACIPWTLTIATGPRQTIPSWSYQSTSGCLL
jgi:hypothetical protein